jgi:hypothetical protein
MSAERAALEALQEERKDGSVADAPARGKPVQTALPLPKGNDEGLAVKSVKDAEKHQDELSKSDPKPPSGAPADAREARVPVPVGQRARSWSQILRRRAQVRLMLVCGLHTGSAFRVPS